MIKSKSKVKPGRIEVDLIGPQGNAYVLLGYVKRWCEDLGRNDCDAIMKEAMSGDYDHLVAVLDREFGDYVTFLK